MKRLALLIALLLLLGTAAQAEFIFTDRTGEEEQTQTEEPTGEPAPDTSADASADGEGWPRKIVITVGGDCTLGCTDGQRVRAEGFARVIRDKGYDWPFSELVEVFGKDDLTLVNFEGTLTESEEKLEGKLFNFKGPAEYAEMLVLGSVEAVNLANNHYGDYKDQGKQDTRDALDSYGITYCASGQPAIYEVRGVKIGLIGNTFPYSNGKRDISKDVEQLRNDGCQIVLASFHWGTEYKDYNRDQRNIGRAAINSGADAVIGHHPHIIQPIEKYNDTYILYSLGNLVFGGNTDPDRDKRDTFIAQFTFTVYEDGTVDPPELKIIPMRLTAESTGTDYRPIFPKSEETYDRILSKILNSSINMEGFVNPD